ncbi:hypothetical protein GGR51DRAFT_500435 [Nemania sp. FL0031]|nr:hypothetical protein GGR51DRAFT_500435 [Nemania sp. FL0031]
METIGSDLEVEEPPRATNSERPKRILVRTKTHLVPGDDYGARCYFMLDRICQHHWNRDFVFGEDRWNSYGTEFGYDNRTCYFLVDHGRSASNDDDVTVLWYEWTGESLVAIQQAMPAEIQRKLREYPFTRPPEQPRPKRGPRDANAMRRLIRLNLRLDIKLVDAEFEFMSKPEHAEWLKNHAENKFWLKFLSQAESHKRQGAG